MEGIRVFITSPSLIWGQTIVSQPGLDQGAGLGFHLDSPRVGPGREQRGNPYVHLGPQRSPGYGVSLTPASTPLRPPHTGTQAHTSGCRSPLTKCIPTHPPTVSSDLTKRRQEGSVVIPNLQLSTEAQGQGRGILKAIRGSEGPGALCCFSFPRHAAVVVGRGEGTEGQGDMRCWVTSAAQEPGCSLQLPALPLEDTQEPFQLPMPTAQPFCPLQPPLSTSLARPHSCEPGSEQTPPLAPWS